MVPLAAFAELSDEPLIGAGVRSRPAYDGSGSQVLEPIPVIRYLGEPWFVRTTQDILEGGVRMALAPGLYAGLQLAYEPGRQTSESDFLRAHRVPYVDRGTSAGADFEWNHMFGPMPVTVLGRARQDTDFNRGIQADLRLSAGIFQGGPLAMGVFTQATWASAKSVGTMYGISAQESVTTGLSEFAPGSGWLFGGLGLLASVDLGRKWTLVGSAESCHLYGDAAHSPLTERTSNFYASLGLAYRL
jgi:outer membrane scaffolding protein for murein synthesis (MipA/OmpV family)